MELKGNSADRWEQFSNKLGELAASVATKKEMITAISSTLDDMMKQLETEQSELEQLGNLAYKEVLREESGTLNDDEDYSQPVFTPTHDDQKPLKQPSEGLTEANTEQPEATAKPTKKAKKRIADGQMMLDILTSKDTGDTELKEERKTSRPIIKLEPAQGLNSEVRPVKKEDGHGQ